MPDARQYFARVVAVGVAIELSTVEIAADADTMECFGIGPWLHYDLVSCAGHDVPAVATELRLITEVTRGREDRYRPIIEYLGRNACNAELVRRGLANAGVTPDVVDRILAEIS
jgi:hypothetical protein